MSSRDASLPWPARTGGVRVHDVEGLLSPLQPLTHKGRDQRPVLYPGPVDAAEVIAGLEALQLRLEIAVHGVGRHTGLHIPRAPAGGPFRWRILTGGS